jgi:hypothetical protein
MPAEYVIRAVHDRETITVYQAYNDAIADAALSAGRFVPPFSLGRMTWIKPSFLWMMHRSGWARKPGQERVLAVRITRAGWEEALAASELTWFVPGRYASREEWQARIGAATVNVQWDPERSLRGGALDHRSIQVGLSRHVIRRYAEEWTVSIGDRTPLVRKIYDLLRSGRSSEAAALLPPERVYPVPAEIAPRLLMDRLA